MREEFHGIDHGSSPTFKQLYGWGTLNTNVWLPSLSELVGIDSNQYDGTRGGYHSAMQGLNVSSSYHSQEKGGSQWAYPAGYNASGGGTLLWALGGKEEFWLRSPDYGQNHAVLSFQSENKVRYICLVTASHAVHPAVSSEQVPYRSQRL